MEEKRYTLAKFFNLGGLSKDEVKAMGAQPAFSSMGDTMQKTKGGSVPPFLQGQVFRVMLSKLNELLDKVDIIEDILAVTWSKSEELFDYLDTEKYPPDEVFMLPLSEHEVASEHNPSVEPYMKEQSLGKFVFNIGINLIIEGVILEIQGGKIKKIHIGSCVGSGSLGCQDSPLLDIPEKEVESVGGVVDLGDGIAIKGGENEGEASAIGEDNVTSRAGLESGVTPSDSATVAPQSEGLSGATMLGIGAAGVGMAAAGVAIAHDRQPKTSESPLISQSQSNQGQTIRSGQSQPSFDRKSLDYRLSLFKYLAQESAFQQDQKSISYIKGSGVKIFKKPTGLSSITLNLLRSIIMGSGANSLDVKVFQFKASAWAVSYGSYKTKFVEFMIPATVESYDFAWLRSFLAKSLSTFYSSYNNSPVTPWLEYKTANFIVSLITIEDTTPIDADNPIRPDELSPAFQIFLANNLAVTFAVIFTKILCISPKSLGHMSQKLQQLQHCEKLMEPIQQKIRYFYDVTQVSLAMRGVSLY